MSKIAEDAVARSRELLRTSQSLANRGAGLGADVARAQAQLARDEQDLLIAQNTRAVTSSRLATLLRLDPAVQVQPHHEPIRRVKLADETLSLATLASGALAQRPDLQGLQALNQAAQKDQEAAKWDPWTPELAATADFGLFGGGTGGTIGDYSDRADYAIFLRWRFEGMGLGQYRRLQAARSRQRQTEIRLNQLADSIQGELVVEQNRLESLSRQITVAAQEETAALESLRFSQARFQGGTGIQLEVLQAQQAVTKARAHRLAAIIDYNQAQHRLLRILGQAPSFTAASPSIPDSQPL